MESEQEWIHEQLERGSETVSRSAVKEELGTWAGAEQLPSMYVTLRKKKKQEEDWWDVAIKKNQDLKTDT